MRSYRVPKRRAATNLATAASGEPSRSFERPPFKSPGVSEPWAGERFPSNNAFTLRTVVRHGHPLEPRLGLLIQGGWLTWREPYSHISRELHIVVLGAGKYTISPRASKVPSGLAAHLREHSTNTRLLNRRCWQIMSYRYGINCLFCDS